MVRRGLCPIRKWGAGHDVIAVHNRLFTPEPPANRGQRVPNDGADMIDKAKFHGMLAKRARVETVSDGDILFREGLDMGSLAFTEFIMEIEEETGIDIDPDQLDASIKTVGQLYDAIARMAG